MTERMTGELFVDPEFKVAIRDHRGQRAGVAISDTPQLGEANAAQLVACWNAVEAAGGDPAIVKDALDALAGAHKAVDRLYATLIERDQAFLPTKSGTWPLMLAVVAVLHRAGRLPAVSNTHQKRARVVAERAALAGIKNPAAVPEVIAAAKEALPVLLHSAVFVHAHHTGNTDTCVVGDCRRFGELRRALAELDKEVLP